MVFCPIAKEECAKNCGLYSEQYDKCAILLQALAAVKNAKATEGASASLGNIAINTEMMG